MDNWNSRTHFSKFMFRTVISPSGLLWLHTFDANNMSTCVMWSACKKMLTMNSICCYSNLIFDVQQIETALFVDLISFFRLKVDLPIATRDLQAQSDYVYILWAFTEQFQPVNVGTINCWGRSTAFEYYDEVKTAWLTRASFHSYCQLIWNTLDSTQKCADWVSYQWIFLQFVRRRFLSRIRLLNGCVYFIAMQWLSAMHCPSANELWPIFPHHTNNNWFQLWSFVCIFVCV